MLCLENDGALAIQNCMETVADCIYADDRDETVYGLNVLAV